MFWIFFLYWHPCLRFINAWLALGLHPEPEPGIIKYKLLLFKLTNACYDFICSRSYNRIELLHIYAILRVINITDEPMQSSQWSRHWLIQDLSQLCGWCCGTGWQHFSDQAQKCNLAIQGCQAFKGRKYQASLWLKFRFHCVGCPLPRLPYSMWDCLICQWVTEVQ